MSQSGVSVLEVCGVESLCKDESKDSQEIAEYLSLSITSGRANILKVVEGLESLLTDKDEFKRLRGTTLLAEVLLRLPRELLSADELKILAAFFHDRVCDHFVITPAALQGYLAIADMTNLADDTPMSILKTLSDNVTCQSLQQTLRYTYYSIIDTLLQNKMKAMLENSSEFIQIVIVAMESESDPRNLMKLYRLLPSMYSHFPLGHLAEEAFTVLECYFPIDFNPRDRVDITREDLSSGLEDCLTATPEFAPFCLPLLLEKLDSDLKLAHIDSLKLLIRGCPIWHIEHINKHLMELWTALKSLLFPGSDAEVTALAVNALVALVVKYSVSPLNKKQADSLNQLLNDITASSYEFIKDAGLSLFTNTAGILSALAAASPVACCHIVSNVIPQFLALLLVPLDHQEVVLWAFQPILKATVIHNIWQTKNEDIFNILSNTQRILVDMATNFRDIPGSFLCLSEILPTLSFEYRQTLYGVLLSSMPKEKSQLASVAYAEFLKKAGTLFPEEVKSQIFSNLSICGIDELPPDEIRRRINMYCCACHVGSLTSYSINRIIESINSTSNITPIGISCLRTFCNNLSDDTILKTLANEVRLPEVLIRICLKLHAEEKSTLCPDETLVDVATIIDTVMKSLNSSDQLKIVESCILSFHFYSAPPPNFSDDLRTSPVEAVLLEGLLGSLRPEIVIPACDKLSLHLLYVSVNSKSSSAKRSASRLLATIVNKENDDLTLKRILDQIIQVTWNTTNKPRAVESVQLCSWVCKGLALRAHSQMNTWIDYLLDLLKVQELQMEAAKGFQLMLTDSSRFLNSDSYCEVRILYKQRLFQWVDKMIKMFEGEEGDTRNAVSMAIAYMLQSGPRQLILGKLQQLIKVMVICLDGVNILVTAAILEVLTGLLHEKEPVLEDYMDTFIPRFIAHSCSPSMNVRIMALDCIFCYANYSPNKLSLYLDLVLNSLTKCLDDKKRLVRQKAVRTRNKWLLLDFS